MDQIKFIGLEDHKKEHQFFINKIQEYKSSIETKKEDMFWIGLRMANYLQDWLLTHIQGTDKKISTYMVDINKKVKELNLADYKTTQETDLWNVLLTAPKKK
jgi:hemerythrin